MRVSTSLALALLGTTTITATAAFAQDADEPPGYRLPSRDALPPLAEGGFMPFATTPLANGNRVATFTSYDSAREAARLDAMVQVRVLSILQVTASLDYDQDDSDPAIGAQLDILTEDRSGIDLQLGVGWDEEGINDVSAIYGEVALGRTYGENYVFGAARIDAGTDGDEAGLRLGAAAVRPLGRNFVAGVDGRLDIDLTSGEPEPMNESGWSLHAGPMIGYAYQMVAITASAGIATDEPRTTRNTEVGAYAGAGLGVAF